MDKTTCSSDNGIHVPDWSTLHIQSDGGTQYIDVLCGLCGESGCLIVADPDAVTW